MQCKCGRVPSPGPAGCRRSLRPSADPIPSAGRRALPAPRVELGAVPPAGWTCSAVWFGIPAAFPRDVPALTDSNGRSQPASSRRRGCGEPQRPRPLPLPLLGLGLPNQVKGLVNVFRTRDSALTSLRVTAKSPTSIPTSVSIPDPFSTSPSHPEPLVRPRSCKMDLSPWAGLGSAAQTPASHCWLVAASPEHKMNEFGCQDFLSHAHPCWGSCADPAAVVSHGQRGAGSSLPAVSGGCLQCLILGVHGSIPSQINSSREPGWLCPSSLCWGLQWGCG